MNSYVLSIFTEVFCIEVRCDPSRRSADGFTALHAVPIFGRANRHACETVELLSLKLMRRSSVLGCLLIKYILHSFIIVMCILIIC